MKNILENRRHTDKIKYVLFLFGKRLIDIFTSCISLILLSPLFLFISILIKIEDRGKVFFSHSRVGYNNEKIKLYKFRSMKETKLDLQEVLSKEEYEEYLKEFKLNNDPRRTKVGLVLRKTSLDELPQLLNILKGDMSLVGPRPIVEEEFRNYTVAEKERLLSVKPGLTGYWQAYARNNASYQMGERQRMELYYVDHASIMLDIKILLKTVQTVFTGKGAK